MQALCNISNICWFAVAHISQDGLLPVFQGGGDIGKGDLSEASFDITIVGGPGDPTSPGEAGDGKGKEDLSRTARKVDDDLAFGSFQEVFEGDNHALEVPVIDAVDLQVYGAVYLAREIPYGLHSLLAARVQLNFRADEDDPISSFDTVFHNQGDDLGGIEARKGDVGLHQLIVQIWCINAFPCISCVVMHLISLQASK